MDSDPLPQIVEDLIRAGVTAVETDGRPRLVFDQADPRAKAMAARAAPALAERRDEAVALFAKLSPPGAGPAADADGVFSSACRVCRADVHVGGAVTAADVHAVCGRRQCPWRERHPEVPTPPTGWPDSGGRK